MFWPPTHAATRASKCRRRGRAFWAARSWVENAREWDRRTPCCGQVDRRFGFLRRDAHKCFDPNQNPVLTVGVDQQVQAVGDDQCEPGVEAVWPAR